MLRQLFQFSLLLFFCGGVAYGLHIYSYSSLFPGNSLELINFSYKFNLGITFIFGSSIILASEKLKEQLGFIFLAGSFVKLGIFIFLIKSAGFSIDKSVFLNFFIPYVVCVVVEIYYVIKMINNTNFGKDN